jgi:glucan phosphoethanolaminetransferase (alkaline phosphatase superfamily)
LPLLIASAPPRRLLLPLLLKPLPLLLLLLTVPLPLLLPCQPSDPNLQQPTNMIKKFALLATVAALFVACGSNNTEAMEQQATEAAAQAEAAAAAAAAEAEAAAAAAAAAVETATDSTAAAVEGAVEEVKEAVK